MDGGRVSRLLKEVAETALVAVWARVSPPAPPPRPASLAPSDNLQRFMNLIMPLRFPTLASKAEAVKALFEAGDLLVSGLNTMGTVHFARFDVVAGNLCMFSVYDGDSAAYIRDFITTIGTAFDLVMTCVKDPPPTPVADNVDAFVDWVQARDAFQVPEWITDLATEDIGTLQRDGLVTLYRHPNIQLGQYRAYPGFSVAQVRDSLSLGW